MVVVALSAHLTTALLKIFRQEVDKSCQILLRISRKALYCTGMIKRRILFYSGEVAVEGLKFLLIDPTPSFLA